MRYRAKGSASLAGRSFRQLGIGIVLAIALLVQVPSATAAPSEISLDGKTYLFPTPPGFCPLDLDRYRENPFVQQVLALQASRSATLLLWLVDCHWLRKFEDPADIDNLAAPTEQIMVMAAIVENDRLLRLNGLSRDDYLDYVVAAEEKNAAQRATTEEALAEINRRLNRAEIADQIQAVDRVMLGFLGRDNFALYTGILNATRLGSTIQHFGSVGAVTVFERTVFTNLWQAPPGKRSNDRSTEERVE